MKGLAIGFWSDNDEVASFPTNIPPEADVIALQLMRRSGRSVPPNIVIYVEHREAGPKVSYIWSRDLEYSLDTVNKQQDVLDAWLSENAAKEVPHE